MFTTYTKYKYNFQIEIGEKFAIYGYSNIDLRLSNHKNNITIFIITNMSWILQFSQNLLSNLLLAKKSIEVFLKKVDQLFVMIADNKIFELADMIENQYIIQLVES